MCASARGSPSSSLTIPQRFTFIIPSVHVILQVAKIAGSTCANFSICAGGPIIYSSKKGFTPERRNRRGTSWEEEKLGAASTEAAQQWQQQGHQKQRTIHHRTRNIRGAQPATAGPWSSPSSSYRRARGRCRSASHRTSTPPL